jgi:hypothetical protein
MFISVNIESAIRAYVIFLKPRFKTLNMKVMFAPQKEHLIPLHICLYANRTYPIRILFNHSLYRYLLQYLLSHSELLLDLLVHVLIVQLLEGVYVHTFYRGVLGAVRGGGSPPSVLVLVVVLEDTLPLIVPVDEVQVVFA